jgi:hypothetical protein
MAEGLTTLLTGDADRALSKFDVALGFDPNDTDALFHIAEVATANGNRKEQNCLDQLARLSSPTCEQRKPTGTVVRSLLHLPDRGLY